MWNTWLNGSTLPALEQTTQFTESRHLLLAGNIANLDTPDYRTRDLSVEDFQSALSDAISASRPQASTGHQPLYGTPPTPPTMPDRGMESSQRVANVAEQQAASERVRDATRQIVYHDGSDVSLEEQIKEISKNQGMHNTAIALMRSQFKTLQIAIRESVNV